MVVVELDIHVLRVVEPVLVLRLFLRLLLALRRLAHVVHQIDLLAQLLMQSLDVAFLLLDGLQQLALVRLRFGKRVAHAVIVLTANPR